MKVTLEQLRNFMEDEFHIFASAKGYRLEYNGFGVLRITKRINQDREVIEQSDDFYSGIIEKYNDLTN